ncbi:MAG TPA: S8 family serine peptidase [Candidatus Saccharimonadales bacterium]|nr:S8 family serine peptidase [Candidatus Saccharimonadales bacterium]
MKWPQSASRTERYSRRGDYLLLFLLLLLSACTASDHGFRSLDSNSGDSSFWVNLRSQPQLAAAPAIRSFAARGQFVMDELQRNASSSQASLIAFLQQQHVQYEPYWISNSIWVRADAATRKQIAAMPEVESIEPDIPIQLPKPPDASSPAPSPGEVSSDLVVEWNVKRTRAPEVWDTYGTKGDGIVVGVLDSGFEPHPALNAQYRGYRSGSSFANDYNWRSMVSGDSAKCLKAPCDDSGHGTHVTGTIIGHVGNHIYGVAPNAKFIACRGISGTSGPIGGVVKCLQWFLAPSDLNGKNPTPALRPQILNISLGGRTSGVLAQALLNLHVAGTLVVAASGNNGGCNTMGYPALYPAVVAVGALNYESDTVAVFSSGGSAGVAKPDVVAGGAQVTSAWLNGGYRTINGTSMAAPAVSGVAALMMSVVPDLVDKPADVAYLLRLSANKNVNASPGRNCTASMLTGAGEVDAYRAIGEATFPRAFPQ